jgi:DNA repair protein RadD
VLDFAGNIHRHGPITNVEPPKKGGDGDGEAPVKVCDNCQEIVHISVMVCPACGTPFPVKARPKLKLGNDDIMGIDGIDMGVESWKWSPHVSQQSGKHMLLVRYYGHKLSDKVVSEYFCIKHEGFAGTKAVATLFMMAQRSRQCKVMSAAEFNILNDMGRNSIFLNTLKAPKNIRYKLDGKFFRVTQRSWE